MRLNQQIVEGSAARIERTYGPLKRLPTPKREMALSRLERVTDYVNSSAAATDINALERAIGTNDLLGLNYFWLGLRAARSVARIVIPPVAGERLQLATGFMIAPGVLLTNWHVLETQAHAARASAQFGYEIGLDGRELPTTWFKLAPNQLYLCNKLLDYCVVAVDGATREGPESLQDFGWLRLNPRLGKTDYGQYLSIIQHPSGQLKQVAIRENKLLPFEDAADFLAYQSDTFRGSSGSPVFNDLWDVVALHHSGKPEKDALGRYIDHDGKPIIGREPDDSEIRWIANEGARVSRIVADISVRTPDGDFKQRLLGSFDGALTPNATMPKIATMPIAAHSLETGDLPELKSDGRALIVVPLDVSLRIERAEKVAYTTVQRVVEVPPPAPVTPAIGATFLEKLNFDADYASRSGYNETFLGRDRFAPMPTIDPASENLIAPTREGDKLLHYHHFSVAMHARRRMPVLSAGNVDYRSLSRDARARDDFGTDQWILDERMEDRYQIPKRFYERWRRLDFGHLVRRDDNCWGGSAEEIEFANADTFHMTNCTPQHEAFNRDRFQFTGLWGQLENLISGQAEGDRRLARLCIFAGPIFTARRDLKIEDEDAGTIYVPLSFWKVVVAPTRRGGISVHGFIVSQARQLDDDPPFVEDFTPGALEEYQVALTAIERLTIVRFDDVLKAADAMLSHPDHVESIMLNTADDLWLGK